MCQQRAAAIGTWEVLISFQRIHLVGGEAMHGQPLLRPGHAGTQVLGYVVVVVCVCVWGGG